MNAGQTDLCREAYVRHSRQIYMYLFRRTRSPDEAEELTQRVFADAAVALARGKQPDSLLGWLYAVAEHRLVDEQRRRARTEDLWRGMNLGPCARPDPEPRTARAIGEAIRRLPDCQREVVVMKVLEGRTFAEIAGRADTTEAACKMRLSRALHRLREDLRREGLEP